MASRLPLHLFPCILAILAPTAAAQLHPELVVGRNGAGELVVEFDSSKPYALPASRFTGIDGYADGMPGLNSLFDATPGKDFFPADPASHLVFVLVGADEGISVWNDRGTGRMKVGDTFTLGKPPFDWHPVWNIVSGEPGKPYALRMVLRDTTGRHGESDVFAPAFTPDDATRVYLCPMQCRGGAIYPESGLCPECAMHLKLVSARSYRVSVVPESGEASETSIRAGSQTKLRFRIESPDGEPVTELEVVHEKLLHLLMVSRDLAWFAHEHPEIQPDGSFVLAFTFPHGGTYTLYHDFTPPGVGMQVVPVEVEVAGDPPPAVPLAVDAERAQLVDGYSFELVAALPLKSIQTQALTVRISREGKPVTDLEPYLGAMGHLIVVSEDREHFVHSHPLEAAAIGTPASAATRGPEVTFQAQFPAPGLYKGWAQMQHDGSVLTAPFVFEVVSPLAALPGPSGIPNPGRDR